ncbi:MAG: aldehyde dehydrogenase [Actinobacteria bacterium BACL4 MAG-120507-bin0]|uniref:aldehyde dehydrogenase family protein n=2 Tax=Candidatus Nanopelagicus sp. TaxID=2518620 RepID=UPI000712874E|nr:MAG: aldehyde dehydrogenase [Actinobacteria bacterium BACL4 MAG-120507-bin0]
MSATYQVINPATEGLVEKVNLADLAATDAVIEKAYKTFESWKKITPADRAKLLRAFAQIVFEHREELAKLEVENSGHTIGNALWEADNVANVLNYYSASPERLFGRQIPVPNGIDITFKEPLGVVGVIVPWNFPMPIASWGFAPALAAGNTVVLKPAEYTPLTAVRLAQLALKAGIPEGVFNVIVGKGSVVGNRFVTHPKVRKIVFTGSTEVGKQIMAGCADQVKRVTLELGGKSANIIFADSDIERAAAAAPGAVFDNAGQDCCARSRLLVERSVFDKFMAAFEASVKKFKVADPSLANTDMGPLISKKQLDSVQSYLTETVAFTGSAPSGAGFWMAPTVLLPKDTKSKSWNEEIFGPVVSVLPFDDEADAIRKANDTEFGLSGSIWTNNSAKAIRVARAVESGNLSVNSNSSVRYWTPFGGYKQSGLGRELGPDALDSFTEVKNVFIATDN